MESIQQAINYKRIARAIAYIQEHFREHPSLDAIAAHVHLSPYHFQRMFTEWAGTSPKKFLQYTQLGYAKQLLKEEQLSLFDTHLATGVGSTSRLHDLFITMEGMSPAAYKHAAEGLQVSYSFQDSPFGSCIIASTSKGICYMSFTENRDQSLLDLQKYVEKAHIVEAETAMHLQALSIFDPTHQGGLNQIKVQLKGTPFQLKVWEALLQIPVGQLRTYKNIAEQIHQPTASRAVGTAIGQNPIAYLIPCHRVIQGSGNIGGYRWDPIRKTAMIGWEQVQTTENSTHDLI